MKISTAGYSAPYGFLRINPSATRSATNAAKNSPSTVQDSVSLSHQSRKTTNVIKAMPWSPLPINTKENAFAFGALKFTSRAWQGEQTAEEAASGWKYCTKQGRVEAETEQNLAGERMTLGRQIETALKAGGIELEKEDALRLSVGKSGAITVDPNGLTEKTRKKLEAIENALNGVSGLSKNLYLNSAATIMNKTLQAENSKPISGARSATLGNDNPLYAAAQRESVDEWLRSTLGFGIDELEAEGYGKGEMTYGQYTQQFLDYKTSEYSFDDGNDLQFTVYNIIKNSEKSDAMEFTATFTYQDGILSDSRVADPTAETADAAVDAFEQLKQAMQSLNATIAVAEDGTVTITGDDDEQIAKLIEKAKQDGSYDKLIAESKTLLAKHIPDSGGEMQEYAVAFGKDGAMRIIRMESATDTSPNTHIDAARQKANKGWKEHIRELINNQFNNPLRELLSAKFDVKM